MTFKQTLNYILGLQGSAFILIAGSALLFVFCAYSVCG
jgi:hypothetical protein